MLTEYKNTTLIITEKTQITLDGRYKYYKEGNCFIVKTNAGIEVLKLSLQDKFYLIVADYETDSTGWKTRNAYATFYVFNNDNSTKYFETCKGRSYSYLTDLMFDIQGFIKDNCKIIF